MGYPMLSDLQDQTVRELIVWLAHGLQVRGRWGGGWGGGDGGKGKTGKE